MNMFVCFSGKHCLNPVVSSSFYQNFVFLGHYQTQFSICNDSYLQVGAKIQATSSPGIADDLNAIGVISIQYIILKPP
jgi:hypothetical protein